MHIDWASKFQTFDLLFLLYYETTYLTILNRIYFISFWINYLI